MSQTPSSLLLAWTAFCIVAAGPAPTPDCGDACTPVFLAPCQKCWGGSCKGGELVEPALRTQDDQCGKCDESHILEGRRCVFHDKFDTFGLKIRQQFVAMSAGSPEVNGIYHVIGVRSVGDSLSSLGPPFMLRQKEAPHHIIEWRADRNGPDGWYIDEPGGKSMYFTEALANASEPWTSFTSQGWQVYTDDGLNGSAKPGNLPPPTFRLSDELAETDRAPRAYLGSIAWLAAAAATCGALR